MKDWNMRFQTLWVVKRQDQLGAMASPAPVIVQSCVPFVTKFAFSMAPLYTRKASSTSTRVGWPICLTDGPASGLYTATARAFPELTLSINMVNRWIV